MRAGPRTARELLAIVSGLDDGRFFGVLTGVYPPAAVFSAPHLVRLLGPRRFPRLARAR